MLTAYHISSLMGLKKLCGKVRITSLAMFLSNSECEAKLTRVQEIQFLPTFEMYRIGVY